MLAEYWEGRHRVRGRGAAGHDRNNRGDQPRCRSPRHPADVAQNPRQRASQASAATGCGPAGDKRCPGRTARSSRQQARPERRAPST